MVDGPQGVDVSRYQGVIDWKTAAIAGIKFAVIRATIGDLYTDPRLFANWEGAKNAGILTTAYHVVRYDADPEAQLAHFIKAIAEAPGDPDLPLVLDVELPSRGGQSPQHKATLENTAAMINTALPDKMIIYTGAWWWNPALQDGSMNWNYLPDLWTASYTTAPYLPSSWSAWHFWQYTNQGKVGGIDGNVDLDVWNGDYQSLMSYSSEYTGDVIPDPDPTPIEEQIVTLVIKGRDLEVELVQG